MNSHQFPEEALKETMPLRRLAFYITTIFVILTFALVIIEIVLRNSDYISSSNMVRNSAVERWMAKNWRVNELGYRDLLLAPRLSSTKPNIYFLGDSFTAGHGVAFNDTFYFKVGVHLEDHYNLFNISQPGLSTLGEHNEFNNFNKATSSRPDISIHQYFVNDIDDYIPKPTWEPPRWLDVSSHYLESAQLLGTLLFNMEHGRQYWRSLLNAYRDTDTLGKHRNDLKVLHQRIRDSGSPVLFLAFPALGNKNMKETAFIIKSMRDFFSRTCQPKDIFIDATPTALSLKESKRVASILDEHPSPELHGLIAIQIIKAIQLESPDGVSYKAYETCESLKAAQARGAETQP